MVSKIMLNKKARFMIVWLFVASFYFIFAIALIEPLKGPLQDTINSLSCTTTENAFIKPVCFLVKGGVVLFIGTFLIFLFRWVYFKSIEK